MPKLRITDIDARESAERERRSANSRIEKLDLELSIRDGLHLSDQLIQPLLGDRSVAFVVYVNSVAAPGSSPSMNTRNRSDFLETPDMRQDTFSRDASHMFLEGSGPYNKSLGS